MVLFLLFILFSFQNCWNVWSNGLHSRKFWYITILRFSGNFKGNFSTIYPLFKRSDPLGRRKSPNWKLFLKNRNAPYFVLNISAKENINKLSGRVVNLFPYWFQLSHACMLEQKKDTVYLEQWKFQINRLFQVKMNQVWFKKEKFKKKPIQSCLLPMPQNLPTANWFNSGFPINISNTRKWPLCIKVGKLQ